MREEAVQPRACGERSRRTAIRSAFRGSAPRVRGTGVVLDGGDVIPRFSPARAGNGSTSWNACRGETVQPRACGERFCHSEIRGRLRGSAPRVRGTGPRPGAKSSCARFSPARAGNGRHKARAIAPAAVQPRACGERCTTLRWLLKAAGSAPRVRGTGIGKPRDGGRVRFSPARAGNGSRQAPPRQPRTVQPRACGERGTGKPLLLGRTGSAPRVRGTVASARRKCRLRRFSPARAGNGRPECAAWLRCAVQPRACGERLPSKRHIIVEAGSAPRVRGTGHFALK